ncbi:DUF983 domain-containing protein [Falsiroseomonas sp.]|uniref:DUF983 domain-containing protein n=1 Tax=Falsiroseomonas sp. TaxID=2870721 RepID=UPI002736D420|nr:DUF983 domain-containing protein [Falsiroseomonas sp.]MDP3418270.1 DUF983 domain-containing protein [Falsiroseomonas sp.]
MTRWEPTRSADADSTPPTASAWTVIGRGMRNRCPVCGEGKVFRGYLRVVDNCEVCQAPLGSLRADDLPPYITIFVAGHVLFPPVLWVEKAWMPPMWLHMAVWLPAFTIACILLLRPIKGGTVGWMARLGFDLPAEAPPGPQRTDHA